MDEYRRLDVQSLIDLLAIETEKYTKACVARVPAAIAYHKAIIDTLVIEINTRKGRRRETAKKH